MNTVYLDEKDGYSILIATVWLMDVDGVVAWNDSMIPTSRFLVLCFFQVPLI